MNKKLILFSLALGMIVCGVSCSSRKKNDSSVKSKSAITTIGPLVTSSVKEILKTNFPQSSTFRIERGVEQTAVLWRESDGNELVFKEFCTNFFIADPESLDTLFHTLSRNYEILFGHFNLMDFRLREPMDLEGDPITPVDRLFGGFTTGAHLSEDLYASKIAFVTALNFPQYSLKEKNSEGPKWSRKEWAYARMGDLFAARIPAIYNQSFSAVSANADEYVSSYNIYVGQLADHSGATLFPKGMKLLSHWNLRDEIKSNYADKTHGLAKQQAIQQVMIRIVDQTIPTQVINSNQYKWNPFTNEILENGVSIPHTEERFTRYQHIINLFAEMKKQDSCYRENNTYIKRKFNGEMEIEQEEVERLFVEFLSSPLKNEVGKLISERLGRKLEPFDIWYDGFKSRSSVHPDTLNRITKRRYKTAAMFRDRIPSLLTQFGFSTQRASEIASRITVDAARGSGHARGASMKGDTAHLRTRIGLDGMDYKGFNIAVHELGHNVEQTISLYDIDYYMLNGVPNTSFTEALAFMFQSRDLPLLYIYKYNPEEQKMKNYDTFWALYEIMGVSLVDMRMWKWLYDNPEATADELKFAVLNISKEVWNEFYAPVFGQKDIPLLAIYSHLISYPLYMSAYAFGHIIHYQLEAQVSGNYIAPLVDRVFRLGRLTPDAWMEQAIGNKISIQPILNAVDASLKAPAYVPRAIPSQEIKEE